MEKIENSGGLGGKSWEKPEIGKTALLIPGIIKELSYYNPHDTSGEISYLKLTDKNSAHLSNLGLLIPSYFSVDKSSEHRSAKLAVEDTKKFIDYLSFLENTDGFSQVEDLPGILTEVMNRWFLKQIDQTNQKPDFIMEEEAFNFLSEMDVILEKLKVIQGKWGSKIPNQFLKLYIRELRALIKFRNKNSLSEFLKAFSDSAEWNEIEKFNDNPEDFTEDLSIQYPDQKSFELFFLKKIDLLEEVLEKVKDNPKYENVFNYVCSFLESLLNNPKLSGYDIGRFLEFIGNRQRRLEKIIQERK